MYVLNSHFLFFFFCVPTKLSYCFIWLLFMLEFLIYFLKMNLTQNSDR